MTKPRRKTTKPNYSPSDWDFRFGPVRVKTNRPLASIAEHWAETEEVVRDYLLDSLLQERLPHSVVLAQFISVPPKREKTPINLRVPAVVRVSEPQWKAFAQGFAYTAHFAQTVGGFSFHNRATQDLKTPSGTIVVFTVEQPAPKEHPFNGVNVVWVQMKDVTPATASHLSEIEFANALLPEEVSDFRLLHVSDVLELESNRKAFRRPISGALQACVQVYPKAGLDGEEEKRLRAFIANTMGTDEGSVPCNPYLNHVAGSLSCGPVILALPKKVYFEDQTQNALVDNSGLSSLLRQGTIVTYAEMEDCFRIAHRLSTLFTSLYGVAHSVAESEAIKRRELRDFALESAAHVLIGPVSDFTNWLLELKSGVPDPVAVDCAVAALGIAKRNAEAILAIAPMEDKQDKEVVLAATEVVAIQEELLHSLAAEFRTCHRLDVQIVLNAHRPCFASSNRPLLVVAVSKLLRNAFEHVLEHKPKKAASKISRPTITVDVHASPEGVNILISNPGPLPGQHIFDRLNSPPVLDGSALLSRKGPMHYGFGTETAKWLVEDKLCGEVKWEGHNGRVLCAITIPSPD